MHYQKTLAPWLAWSADFTAGPGVSGPATVVLAGLGSAAAGEPWFVRAREYPAIGSALAWERPVVLEPGGVIEPALRHRHRRRSADRAAGGDVGEPAHRCGVSAARCSRTIATRLSRQRGTVR